MRNTLIQQRARTLRSNSTDTERYLWQRLRGKQVAGSRIRRQVPIGPYIADFVCLEAKLVVEVDGSQHGGDYDQTRDQVIQSHGFLVLRFWNNEVLQNIDGVLDVILRALQESQC
jgi:very-short-patch-repair endonuclease